METDEAEELTIGVDGRMDAPGGGTQLFLGHSPECPETRMLAPGGPDERAVISLLEEWLGKTQGGGRQERLRGADWSDLQEQDCLDRLAIEFLLEVRATRDG